MVGLTGGLASGKTTVSKQLESKGFPIIDTDLIVHELIESDPKVKKDLEKEFGTTDRSKLRKIVFADPEKRRLLEKLIHHRVGDEVQERIVTLEKQKPQKAAAVVVVPLLFEIGWQKFFEPVVAVLAKPNLQIKRLIARDKIDEDLAKKMLNSQLSNEDKEQKANFVIWNNGTLKELEKEVESFLKKSKLGFS